MKTPANPENVPLDKIPAGWRLIYEEEYGCESILPCRIWRLGSKAEFSSIFSNSPYHGRCTYITPCLPDNGQPWHAHKPGDPAPVEDVVKVDIVCRNGLVFSSQLSPFWRATTRGELDILFYRLHDPATTKTESNPPSPTSDRILSILIAAGHITEEQVERARKLAQM